MAVCGSVSPGDSARAAGGRHTGGLKTAGNQVARIDGEDRPAEGLARPADSRERHRRSCDRADLAVRRPRRDGSREDDPGRGGSRPGEGDRPPVVFFHRADARSVARNGRRRTGQIVEAARQLGGHPATLPRAEDPAEASENRCTAIASADDRRRDRSAVCPQHGGAFAL